MQRVLEFLRRRWHDATSPSQPPIALYYFDSSRHPNFGDRLNVDLLQRLAGRRVRSARAEDATHVCIGSLLEAFLRRQSSPPRGGPPLAVWGAGFIAPPGQHPALQDDALEEFVRPLAIHAVRGRLTLERLRAMGEDVSGTALGDPGLLARLLLPSRPARRRIRLGLVAHYVDEHDPVFARVRARIPSSRIIRVGEDPIRFLSRLRECEVVVSSAMHGLIAADALGIPNLRVRASDRLTGGDYKFHDYYSVFGVNPRPLSREEFWNLSPADVARIEGSYAIDTRVVDRVIDALRAACPFATGAAEPPHANSPANDSTSTAAGGRLSRNTRP